MFWVLSLLVCSLWGMQSDKEEGRSSLDIQPIQELHTLNSIQMIEILENQHDIIHDFLHKHARKGSQFRDCLEKAVSESSSSSDSSIGKSKKRLSQVPFDELLSLLGTAANIMELKNKHQKNENNKLKYATLIASCYGVTCTALVTVITTVLVSVLTYLQTTK
jgi:hypothetical protein